MVPIDPALTEPVGVSYGIGIVNWLNGDLLGANDELWVALHLANGKLLSVRAASDEAMR